MSACALVLFFIQDLINAAWRHFKAVDRHQHLVVLQDDVIVQQGVFDTMAACSREVAHASYFGPLINAMNVGEKSTPMDETLLSWQNSHHRRTRKLLAGRMPKDCHVRLPCTCWGVTSVTLRTSGRATRCERDGVCEAAFPSGLVASSWLRSVRGCVWLLVAIGAASGAAIADVVIG